MIDGGRGGKDETEQWEEKLRGGVKEVKYEEIGGLRYYKKRGREGRRGTERDGGGDRNRR